MAKNTWSLNQQEQFLQRIGQLYSNGYTILEAIELYSLHASPEIQSDLKYIIDCLKEGQSFHAILSKLQFHSLVLSLLFFSQQHGDLGNSLKTSSELLKNRRMMREKIMKTIRYPFFLFFFVFLMLLFVKIVLVPQFEQLFLQLNIHNSLLISVMLLLVTNVPTIFGLFFCLVLIIFITYPIWKKKLSPEVKVHLLLKLPFITTVTSYYYTQFFADQLSQLLHAGLSINESLEVFEQQSYSQYFQKITKHIQASLVDGESLEAAIAKEKVFDAGLAVVLVHGQKNGSLSKELQDYSQLLLQLSQQKIEKLISILQPVILSSVGVFVMLLYLCIFIPMFQLLGGI